MKILVFGSTGGVGYQLVNQALEQGHTVTAFARDATKINIKHNNLHVAEGDVMDPASVEKAVKGTKRCCVHSVQAGKVRFGRREHEISSARWRRWASDVLFANRPLESEIVGAI